VCKKWVKNVQFLYFKQLIINKIEKTKKNFNHGHVAGKKLNPKTLANECENPRKKIFLQIYY